MTDTHDQQKEKELLASKLLQFWNSIVQFQVSIKEVNIKNGFIMKTLHLCPQYHNVEIYISYECCKNEYWAA